MHESQGCAASTKRRNTGALITTITAVSFFDGY